MTDYIDIDTQIDVAVYQRNRRIQVTLRQILDSNDAKYQAADVVSGRDFRDCRNELCLKCGAYKERHLGACDGCRWRAEDG